MLKITEFNESEVLKSSDGSILRQFPKQTYVALWDDKEVTSEEIDKYIIEQRGKWIDVYNNSIPHNKFIVMTKREWLRLSDMIKNNYELIEKR